MSELEGCLLRDMVTNTTILSSNIQSGQPVTNLSASLSNNPFISRPINFTGVANCGKITPDIPVTMLLHGKAPPIDSFAEDISQ